MHAFRFARVVRGETKNVEICVCMCRCARVLRGETKTQKCVCMCRFARVFRGETNTLKIVEKCVCVASCLFSGPGRKIEKSVCVCVSPHKGPVYNLPLFGALEKCVFTREMARGAKMLLLDGSNAPGDKNAVF